LLFDDNPVSAVVTVESSHGCYKSGQAIN
jgi:hypothetical protein